jgi:hypothetical protein
MGLLEVVAACVLGLPPYLVIARMVAGHVAYVLATDYAFKEGVPDSHDWEGILAGIFWPLVAVVAGCAVACEVFSRHTPKVGAEARHIKKTERLRVLAAVRSAEKELGIGGEEG